MIISDLHRQPVSIDRVKHRQTVVRLPITDWSFASGLNALFLTAAEIANAARDYPVVWIKAGQNEDGSVDVAPVAVFGFAPGENLFQEGKGWRMAHMPSMLATYPFCVARLDASQYAVCLDASCSAVGEGGEGQRLIGDDGEPTPFMTQLQGELERLEGLIDQTRVAGRRLHELGLLADRRFDATLPDGRKISLDGFMIVDEEKVKALPDATVLELYRNGLLGLIQAHWLSLGHMGRLVSWRVDREAALAGRPPASAA